MDSRSEDKMILQIERNLSDQMEEEYPLYSNEHINKTPVTISRAEYIRQAREACLQKLSDTQLYSRPYDVQYMDSESMNSVQSPARKMKWNLFQEGGSNSKLKKEDSPQEIASFHFLIIRTVCAIVIFLAIFVIDKFDFHIGALTPDLVQEYVTGNDQLEKLEDLVVTWLK